MKMREISKDELNEILKKHKLWMDSNWKEGERANLREADLSYAKLRYADLRYADLRYADLYRADLYRADLRFANLCHADLKRANLREADLRNADLDYSAFPLWCGGLYVHIDDRQAIQMLYHLVCNVLYSKNTSEELKKILSHDDIIRKANEFHRVDECGEIKRN